MTIWVVTLWAFLLFFSAFFLFFNSFVFISILAPFYNLFFQSSELWMKLEAKFGVKKKRKKWNVCLSRCLKSFFWFKLEESIFFYQLVRLCSSGCKGNFLQHVGFQGVIFLFTCLNYLTSFSISQSDMTSFASSLLLACSIVLASQTQLEIFPINFVSFSFENISSSILDDNCVVWKSKW